MALHTGAGSHLWNEKKIKTNVVKIVISLNRIWTAARGLPQHGLPLWLIVVMH